MTDRQEITSLRFGCPLQAGVLVQGRGAQLLLWLYHAHASRYIGTSKSDVSTALVAHERPTIYWWSEPRGWWMGAQDFAAAAMVRGLLREFAILCML
jgi:hypothetical protein